MLHTRPHVAWLLRRIPRLLGLSISNAVVSFFGFFCVGLVKPDLGVDLLIGLLLAWVLAFPALYATALIATWLTTHYVVTDRRVFICEGIIRRNSYSIPLAQITNLSSGQGAVDRMLGSGNLLIRSGGQASMIVLHHLPHIKQTHTKLLDLFPSQRPPSIRS